jgi:hypothetical protein
LSTVDASGSGRLDVAQAGHRWRGPVLVGTAILLVIVVGVVVAWRMGAGEQTDPAVEPADSANAVSSQLPEQIQSMSDITELPPDGTVGLGALTYTPCGECDTVLVLADGTQYSLPGEGGAALFGYSVSPDGHWLASTDATGVQVRELVGDRTHVVETPEGADGLVLWAWSADSRWLLLGESDVDASPVIQPTAVLLDLTDGTSTRVTAPDGRMLTAVLPSGELLAIEDPLGFGDVTGRRTQVLMERLDPASDGSVEQLTIDAGEWLQEGETLAQEGDINGVQLVAPSEDSVFVSVFGETTGPTALLEVGLDGRVLSRLEIATELPDRQIWWLAGQHNGQPVVALAQFTTGGPERSFTLHAVSGDGLRQLTVLESAFLVRLAGTAAQGGAPY